jgi:MFS family permease
MFFRKMIKNVYFNDTPLSRKDYHHSRTMFIFEGSTAVSIFALTSGAFLAGYASYLGANDQFNGIIGAIPALAGIIQVFSPMVFEKMQKRKFLISILCLFYRLLLGFMVFIPLITPNTTARLALLAGSYFLAYLSASFITPAAGNWIIELAPVNIRGRYFGLRESYIQAFAAAVSLSMGKVLDIFSTSGRKYEGFVLVFSVALVITVVNFIFLSSIKEPPARTNTVPLDIKSILTIPLQNKGFRKIVVLFMIWNIAAQIGMSYFAVYQVTGLKLPYTFIMLMSILSTVSSVVFVRIWGRIADRKSWTFTSKISIGLLAFCHMAWFFVSKNTAYAMIPVLYFLAGTAWSGINISLFNIQFIFSPEEGRTVYTGFNAALGGAVGFVSALIGSFIVGALSGAQFTIAGFSIGNMQVVFGLSGILLVVCAGFIHLFVRTE